MAKKNLSGIVVAREAIVIEVGGKPRKYGTVDVTDRKTGEKKTIPYTDSNYDQHVDYEEEVQGVPYAFRPMQKVPANHPAVKACPGAFMPLSEVDDLDAELLTS